LAQMVYENAEDAHAIGWELSAVRADGERSRVELNYTWMDAQGTWSREEGVPYGPLLTARPASLGPHAPDWDRRHALSLLAQWTPARGSLTWTTALGSPLPWTPRERRVIEADVTRENTRRLGWEEWSSVAARWSTPWRVTVGLDVTNVFDRKNEL